MDNLLLRCKMKFWRNGESRQLISYWSGDLDQLKFQDSNSDMRTVYS